MMKTGRLPAFLFLFLVMLVGSSPAWAASVEDAGIGTAVEDRALLGAGSSFDVGVGKLYCFTRVLGAGGTTIRHVWQREGATLADVPLSIGSDNWRTWSSKRIVPGMEGAWTVKVLAGDGSVLKELSFTVGSAGTP